MLNCASARSGATLTRRPSRMVPLVEPRSRRISRPSFSDNSQCWRLIMG